MTIKVPIFIKDGLFNAVKYGSHAIEVGFGVWPESWIDDNCSKLYQRVMEIQDRIKRFYLSEELTFIFKISLKNLMTAIINWNEDETKMTQGLVFLEGCALQLPNNFLQLKNALLIEIMQQLNQLGKQM